MFIQKPVHMFQAALFITALNWEQLRFPSAGGVVLKNEKETVVDSYHQYYSATKSNPQLV